ncbi:MAG: single-stranded DNA-binding protein, partial [Kiritimatiellae bacterium]|nr:single-stranded DNA-binding protein [Kiritimatiellia bacterium]
MSSMNKVFVMGNLTRDPELRQTPSGAAVVELGVAVNEDYRNKAGEIVKSVCFVDVVAWNRQAETCAQYLHKGSGVLVEGKLQQDHWETPEGQKKSRMR